MRSLSAEIRFDAVVDLLSFRPDQVSSTLGWIADTSVQYVLVSSATIFAGAHVGARLTEGSPQLTDGWAYASKKIASEQALRIIASRDQQLFTIVRPYITYSEQRLAFGAWEGEVALARLRAGQPIVIGDEIARARTSLTHAGDVAGAIVALLGNPAASSAEFNIATAESTTWRDVYATVSELLDVPLDVIDAPVSAILSVYPELGGKVNDRVLDRTFDPANLHAACPGFEFSTTFESGYRSALDQALPSRSRSSGRLSGKMDRLLAVAGAPRERLDFMRQVMRISGLRQRAGYVLGRSQFLSTTYGRLRNLDSTGDYSAA
ncbi:hypothetical protein GCM10009717_31120 [Agromyces allii]|uniref:NAD-dependent epimerase/dehydratase domain-containing protein n=2 Tax=Agromyces allii TaxID=393607 RepID=A0ABN2R2K0_9MICO